MPHGDNHDLWIAPEDPRRMVEGNDGGATVSFDAGESWSTLDNQPTAQFYHVITDDQFPYHVYGAQQDNSTVAIASRTGGAGIGVRDWHDGGRLRERLHRAEAGRPRHHLRRLLRRLHRRGSTGAPGRSATITVWPDNPMGWGAEGMKYRFQWTFPIVVSPHDPDTLYAAGNVLFRTTNEGSSWEAIAPDLTRNDKAKLGPSGGPITKDNTSVEYYGTIFALAESPRDAGVLWAGSDDGLVHVTARRRARPGRT